MFHRLFEVVDKLVRGLIYLSLVSCGAAIAILAAVVTSLGCWRVGQFLWTHLLGRPWGGD